MKKWCLLIVVVVFIFSSIGVASEREVVNIDNPKITGANSKSKSDFGFSIDEALKGTNDLGGDEGNYTLHIAGESFQKYEGSINSDSTVNYCLFTVTESEKPTKIAIVESEFVSVMHLFKDEGKEKLSYISYDDAANSTENLSAITMFLPAGKYVVAVSGFGLCDKKNINIRGQKGNGNYSTGRVCPSSVVTSRTYDFSFSPMEVIWKVNNINKWSSYKISFLAEEKVLVKTEKILKEEPVSTIPFSVTSLSEITIQIDDAQFQPVIYIFRDDGALSLDDYVAYADSANGNLSTTVQLKKGKYVVFVSAFGICGCSYARESRSFFDLFF